MRFSRTIAAASAAFLFTSLGAAWADSARAPASRPEPWLVKSLDELKVPPPSTMPADELAELKSIMAKRTDADLERIRWWATGGPAYRWNEIAIGELLDSFVVVPMAARHLALLHAAIDDAVAAAWQGKKAHPVKRPGSVDATLKTALPVPAGSSYPSDYAAAAAAAAEVLGQLLPERAAAYAAMAEEAMNARLLAGLEYPGDVAAGRALGRKVAALAIARGKEDGSDAKWTGTVPQGPGKWQGTNPAAPMAGTWKTWLLTRQDELRPPPPPAFDSEQAKSALNELKQFQRTPKSNHRAAYWETFGGARVHALWNDMARVKLLEHGSAFDAPAASRALAALNIAIADAAVACWEAKYAYWYIRPPQLDPELKTVFPPPNHPSYPAAHGCLSTAGATVLAGLFPRDKERMLAMGKEAAEARVWAGIHYRFDIDAGQTVGRQAAEKALARAIAAK
jgi:hypothetical protein